MSIVSGPPSGLIGGRPVNIGHSNCHRFQFMRLRGCKASEAAKTNVFYNRCGKWRVSERKWNPPLYPFRRLGCRHHKKLGRCQTYYTMVVWACLSIESGDAIWGNGRVMRPDLSEWSAGLAYCPASVFRAHLHGKRGCILVGHSAAPCNAWWLHDMHLNLPRQLSSAYDPAAQLEDVTASCTPRSLGILITYLLHRAALHHLQ
ncbi:hypothetical protein HD806DRAFT_518240 [Xylariaceae sp. AK1471]|nr:hypothetical protein HD806DRAFT_518240 [Xylariaceae sp. AK1471]